MKKIISVTLATLLIFFTVFRGVNVSAAYSGETKQSVYNYKSVMSKVYPSFAIKHDNHGYYATYKNNGSFEIYLGKSKNMQFSDFAKKFGGSTRTNEKVFTIKKSTRELQNLGFSLLVSYLCTQAGCPWYASTLIGVAGDKVKNKLLREPGTYRMTTVASSVRIRNGAIKGKGYSETHYIYPYSKLEKKVNGKWKTLSQSTNPMFIW